MISDNFTRRADQIHLPTEHAKPKCPGDERLAFRFTRERATWKPTHDCRSRPSTTSVLSRPTPPQRQYLEGLDPSISQRLCEASKSSTLSRNGHRCYESLFLVTSSSQIRSHTMSDVNLGHYIFQERKWIVDDQNSEMVSYHDIWPDSWCLSGPEHCGFWWGWSNLVRSLYFGSSLR